MGERLFICKLTEPFYRARVLIIVMKNLLIVAGVILLVACGESSRTTAPGSEVGVPPGPGGTSGYITSQPLVDNSDVSIYQVLLMGNSHAAGLSPVLEQLLMLGQPNKSIDVQFSRRYGFLSDLVNDGFSEQILESEEWSHVILQGQKYSSTRTTTYPTDAAEYWIRGSKEQGATSIMFPEHPRRDNDWEGQTLFDLHAGIAARENTCVAPVGLIWDEVIFRLPSLVLHQPDGNHAADTGLLLTALVFYQIITGQPVETLPELSVFGVEPGTEQIMKESVSTLLAVYPPCHFEG